MTTQPAEPAWDRPPSKEECVAFVCVEGMLAALLNALSVALDNRNIEQVAAARRELAATGRMLTAVAEGNNAAARRISDEAAARLAAMGVTE